MRRISVLFALLLFSAFAQAQYAGYSQVIVNWNGTGVYTAPSTPLVSTPSLSLSGPPAFGSGATNATAGNVAGATNSTLTLSNTPQASIFPVPTFYGSSAFVESQPEDATTETPEPGFRFGVTAFQSSRGAAGLRGPKPHKAAHIYTNDDVSGVNRTNGSVKFRNKTEHVD